MFADLRLAFAIYDARLYHLVTAPFNWSTLSFSLLLTSACPFISMLLIAYIVHRVTFTLPIFVVLDMEFAQNFTLSDFQAKNLTPSISPNFNSFSKKKHKK